MRVINKEINLSATFNYRVQGEYRHENTNIIIIIAIIINSLNCEGRWGTTNDLTPSFLHFFSVLHCPLGLGELLACPFPDVVFPPFFLSALSNMKTCLL